jgi:hypothetical protein
MNRPSRRWLRFNLRTMFVLLTAVTLWLGWELSIVRQRRLALAELMNNPAAHVFTDVHYNASRERASLRRLRMLLGDEPVALIRFDLGQPPGGAPGASTALMETLKPDGTHAGNRDKSNRGGRLCVE